MKILLCADESSANTTNWVAGLRELGCEVIIASARIEKNDEDIIALGNPRIPPRLRFLTSKTQLKKIIARENPDILIGYRVTSYGYLASSTDFRPLVLAAQNEQITYLPEPNIWREKLLGYFARKAIKKADVIHAWGANIKEGLKKFGAKDEQIFVMHRGIDIKNFSPSERKTDVARPVFISTRSLSSEYRIDHLIRAFFILLRKIPLATLKIIGDGPEKNRLSAFVKDLGIAENVTFYGKLSTDSVADELKKSDIYVSVIQTEGISSSLLEACACGVFPIVGDIPASRTVLENEKSGILIPNLAPGQLAKTMEKALYDEKLRKNAVEKNIETIRLHYDIAKNIRNFLEFYKKLIQPG